MTNFTQSKKRFKPCLRLTENYLYIFVIPVNWTVQSQSE